MDQILLNPGYHDVSKRILYNLNDHSLVILSQTIKGFSKLCEPILIKRGQKRLADDGLNAELYERQSERYLIIFMWRNQIFHEGHFKFPFCETKTKKELHQVLEEFFEILAEIKDWNSRNKYLSGETVSQIQIENLLQRYVKFLPGHCPANSKKHVLKLLNYAMKIKNVEMAKSLLRSIKDYNSCVWSMTKSILTVHPFVTKYALLPVFKEIASECKNPNMPDLFGTTPLHHAVKLGEHKIVKILLDNGNNLDAVNQYGQNALQIAEEKGHE